MWELLGSAMMDQIAYESQPRSKERVVISQSTVDEASARDLRKMICEILSISEAQFVATLRLWQKYIELKKEL